MSMIFPGMDPFLENPQLWPGFHHALVVYVRDHLRPLIAPRYVAAVEDRVYLEGPDREVIPDVWVRRGLAESHPQPQSATQSTAAVLEEETPLLVKVPALEIRHYEPYITILDRTSGQKIVTVIEVVSPSNKSGGPGRKSYVVEQEEVLGSDANLVEWIYCGRDLTCWDTGTDRPTQGGGIRLSELRQPS